MPSISKNTVYETDSMNCNCLPSLLFKEAEYSRTFDDNNKDQIIEIGMLTHAADENLKTKDEDKDFQANKSYFKKHSQSPFSNSERANVTVIYKGFVTLYF